MNEINTTDILNEIEQEKIALFNEDKIMNQAVKKILLRGIYQNGTLKAGVPADPTQNFLLAIASNPNQADEKLGQELRAAIWGVKTVEDAFNKMGEIKRDEKLEDNNLPPQ